MIIFTAQNAAYTPNGYYSAILIKGAYIRYLQCMHILTVRSMVLCPVCKQGCGYCLSLDCQPQTQAAFSLSKAQTFLTFLLYREKMWSQVIYVVDVDVKICLARTVSLPKLVCNFECVISLLHSSPTF